MKLLANSRHEAITIGKDRNLTGSFYFFVRQTLTFECKICKHILHNLNIRFPAQKLISTYLSASRKITVIKYRTTVVLRKRHHQILLPWHDSSGFVYVRI